jgi:SAM-dependent methyltransferase
VSPADLQESLLAHLAWWGLTRFVSDAEYFAWQREKLSASDLNQLNAQVERKRGGDRRDEIAFYDLTARSKILPVLYSQRYEYYSAIGLRVAFRMGEAKTVLDFGCGVGILTTFYARQYPDKTFVGIDRSPVSIGWAQERALALGLKNVRFECMDVTERALSGQYNFIVATHALVQAEQDPGLPSRDWTTFERPNDSLQQRAFEERTGIGLRLDRLNAVLAPCGHMIVFEKTRQLARRVPFQRALAARGLSLIEWPEAIRYQLVEEIVDDGPFYVLQKGMQGNVTWDESPEPDEGPAVDRERLLQSPREPEAPLYENHWPSAQHVWERLQGKRIAKEITRQEPDGRQLHVELGHAEGYAYLYCSNTFDQRQLVMFPSSRSEMLDAYYREIIGLHSTPFSQ